MLTNIITMILDTTVGKVHIDHKNLFTRAIAREMVNLTIFL